MPGRGQKHDLSSPPIVVVENVQCYRECAAHYLTPKDVVIEIGAAQGCTTSVIAQYAGKVVAVDKSPFNVGVAKERYPSIRFYEMDAMDISGLMELHKQYPFNKVFLDISGSQPVGPLATLLEKYERAFPGIDLFVVKSYRLKKLVGASTVFPEEVLGRTRNPTAQYMTLKAAPGQHAATSAAEEQQAGQEQGQREAAGRLPVPCWLASLPSRLGSVCIVVTAFVAGVAVGMRRR